MARDVRVPGDDEGSYNARIASLLTIARTAFKLWNQSACQAFRRRPTTTVLMALHGCFTALSYFVVVTKQ